MVTKDFFTDILTLRYHPDNTTTHVLPKDFISSKPLLTLENNTDILDNMLTKTIKNSIKTKSVAIGLSGGIDSCTILAKIRNVLPDIDIHCITVGFHNNDVDMTSASKIAKYFDCKFHSVIVENPLETLPMQISLSEEPRWNTFWTYVVNHAKNYSDVLISGDGGDEVFAGYTFRYSKFLKLLSPNDGWVERTIKYLKCHERDWVDDQNEMFTAKMNFSWNNIYHKLKPYFDNELKPLNQVLLADYNGKLLYDWVPTNYKIHKKLKMNAYFPLLDTEIVHHGLSLPLEQKYNVEKNEGKIPLRLIFEKYGHNDLLLKEKKVMDQT